MVVILPSNTRPGNAATVTWTSWPTRKAGLSALGDIRQHPHGVDVGDRVGRRRVAGLHEQPGRRVARRDPAGDRARHDQRRVGAAVGDDLVDLGIGLAEEAHRIARGPQLAFGGLLVGDRLLEIVLRHRLASYRARAGAPDCGWSVPARLPPRSRSTSACSRSGLSMVNSVCPFFTSSPTSAEQRDDPPLIGREDLHRQLLVEIDAADRLLLDRKLALLDRRDLDRGELRIRQIHAVPLAGGLSGALDRSALASWSPRLAISRRRAGATPNSQRPRRR